MANSSANKFPDDPPNLYRGLALLLTSQKVMLVINCAKQDHLARAAEALYLQYETTQPFRGEVAIGTF
ncbi:hypothetical protein ACFS5N_14725 [Mucilaginibacter ximonensis]|uniref:Uncharacterized protein n=1 Tax=Mucilaginibacter ximonensis TaxID=538021 RepID=A0ABW5YFY1_9SPHI